MLQLSVVIVNYNVKYYVHQCLCSVEKAAQGIDHEIFLVDNHSTDGSDTYLPPLHPRVRFIWNQENVGFARANNQALLQASGRYVLLLNPDTLITEHTLTDLIALMDARPDAGAIGVKMLDPDGRFAPESRRGIPTPFTAFCKMTGLCCLLPKSRTFGRYYMQYLDASHVNEIEVISGACFFTRRSTLNQSGYLDEDFFMYGEDIDLSYRILQTGLKNLYLPTPILHYKGESTHESTYHYVRIFYQAMLIFFRKHFSHYSILVSLPVKFAIFAKGVEAYLRLALKRHRREDPDYMTHYFQRSTFALHADKDRDALQHFLTPYGILLSDTPSPDFLVFNAETTDYADMLRCIDRSSDLRHRPILVTWYPSQRILVTPMMVFTPSET
ncbi:MAG: glycosyltransferase family 2 protein [Bacteroidales bacterium]|nr:glycosyltransferase family 2 protein [Bacteroidales bacterium]